MTSPVGTLYSLWMSDNSVVQLSPECAPLVDRAMKQWAERRMDTWIDVETPTGSAFSLLASTITSAMTTTAQQRAEAHARDKAIEDERLEQRRLAGFIESE